MVAEHADVRRTQGATVTDSPNRMDLDEALELILADTRPVNASEALPVEAALGRFLSTAVDAPLSLPPFAASAMDGYAVHSSDFEGSGPFRLKVAGTSYAGRPFQAAVARGHCVRIFTGAPVPADLDAVVIQEDVQREVDRIVTEERVKPGAHVRGVGHDVAAGTRLLDAGRRLTEYDLGWLAACGRGQIDVNVRPVVGIFSTGDELCEAGDSLGPGQIYDANRMALKALLSRLPVRVEDYGIVPDDRGRIQRVLEQADEQCQMVVTSGGVSVGDADWVKDVVAGIGSLRLWKLNIKPGKPLAYGRLRQAAFFGLPGNPVSTVITALMLVIPALERLCGGDPAKPLSVPAVLRGRLQHSPGREEFQRGTLRRGQAGLEVSVTGDQSSNRLSSFALANCLIRIPEDCGDVDDGSVVTTLPLRTSF